MNTTWGPRATGRAVANSSVMEWAARWGLTTRGVLYLLIGALAGKIAFGEPGGQADRGGAVQQLSEQPFGKLLVWAAGLGLAAMAVWQLSEAAFGASGADGRKATRRLAAAARCAVYAAGAFSVIAFAMAEGNSGSGSSDAQSKDVTAEVLDLPAGRWLLGVAGLVLVGAGGWMALQAWKRTFRKHLALGSASARTRRIVEFLGVAGGICRGAVFAAAGGFAVAAAVQYDARQAKGMDDTLRSFSTTPVGPWLLVVVAAGLMLYGLFSFAMARWRAV